MMTGWKNLRGLNKALSSTTLIAFGMNWNVNDMPGLLAKHQCPSSCTEWAQILTDTFQNIVEKLPRIVIVKFPHKFGHIVYLTSFNWSKFEAI